MEFLGRFVKEKETKVKRSLLFVMILTGWTVTQVWAQGRGLLLPSADLFSAAQAAGTNGTSPGAPAGKIGASAEWEPPKDFLANAHAVCDKVAGPASYGECFIHQMSVAGASADVVSFTRMLYQQSEGQVGILNAFKKYGPVDAAQVFYPLRANDNYGLLLVNGDPEILDVDDMKKLDLSAMRQDPLFQAMTHQFPKVDLFPGDRSSSDPWPRVQPLPGGGQQFVVTYPLLNGCHACARLGLARFGWDFDASGKFLRTTYIPTPPPPKLLKRPQKTPPPQPPSQSQPQAQSNPQ